MHDAPMISPENKDSSRETIAALPKVDLHVHLPGPQDTPEALTDAVRKAVAALAADNVVYAELRICPEQYSFRPAEVIQAALAGLDHDSVDARLVPTAIRQLGHAAEMASLTIECAARDRRVVGFDVAGEGPLAGLEEACAALRAAYVPFSIHALEEEEVATAIALGATRVGHGLGLIDDFSASLEGIEPGKMSAWVRDRHIALETAPLLELQLGVDELPDHPLPLFQQLGFTCTVNSGNTSIALTDVFMALHETFGYNLEEFFDVTVKALENSYASEETRQDILARTVLPAYEELSDAEFAEDAAAEEEE